MIKAKPLYITKTGGSIICFLNSNKRFFQSCSGGRCSYSFDLHSAKEDLDTLEMNRRLPGKEIQASSKQRKTTLKWNKDGELSSIDMTRLLSIIELPELTACELTCSLNNSFK